MKKFLLIAAFICTGASSAFAADICCNGPCDGANSPFPAPPSIGMPSPNYNVSEAHSVPAFSRRIRERNYALSECDEAGYGRRVEYTLRKDPDGGFSVTCNIINEPAPVPPYTAR